MGKVGKLEIFALMIMSMVLFVSCSSDSSTSNASGNSKGAVPKSDKYIFNTCVVDSIIFEDAQTSFELPFSVQDATILARMGVYYQVNVNSSESRSINLIYSTGDVSTSLISASKICEVIDTSSDTFHVPAGPYYLYISNVDSTEEANYGIDFQ